MNILRKLKPVKTEHLVFEPVNGVEKLLLAASNKPKKINEFYLELLKSDIYVIPLMRPAIWNDVATKGQKIQLMGHVVNDVFFVSFFSSLERVAEASSEGEGALKLSARDFFKLTTGSYLVMNPKSALGKEFFPAEINDILQLDYDPSPRLD